jgi:hypothetical protein
MGKAPNFLKALYKRLVPDQGETNYRYQVLIMDVLYEGDSNENLKSAIKIQNTARLSCKLTIMILMV